MKKTRSDLIETSADEFAIATSIGKIYKFPFLLREDLRGRIELQIEPIFKKEYCKKLLICAQCTSDPRWCGKIYTVECNTPMVSSGSMPQSPLSYFSGVWSVGYCLDHKTIFFRSYPPDNTSKLVINPSSSVMVTIGYE